MADDRHDFSDSPEQPPYGKSQVAYPGANPDDLIVIEDVPIPPEQYSPLAIGTPHPKNTETGLDLRLVWQGPVKGTDAYKYVRRVYATPRSNEDFNNYAIQYSGQSKDHPIFLRHYIVRRLDYVPLTENTPLTGIPFVNVTAQGSNYNPETTTIGFTGGGGGSGLVMEAVIYEGKLIAIRVKNEGSGFTAVPVITINDTGGGSGATAAAFLQPAGAKLVHQEVKELEDPQLASLFVRVIRVYETLPGPPLVSRSIGAINLFPEKYRRLVRTVETNQTVGPDYTFPAGLTGDQSFISAAQEEITKLRLKIIEEVIDLDLDPLFGEETGEWGIGSIQESVVDDGTDADEGYLVKTSRVSPLGNGKSIKITVFLPDDLASRSLQGQKLDEQFNIPVPFTETEIPQGTGIGIDASDITPEDYQRARKRSYNTAALELAFDTYLLSFESKMNIRLPNVLESVDPFMETQYQDGDSSKGAPTGFITNAGSFTSAPNSRSTAAVAALPDVSPNIREPDGENRTVSHYMFLMKQPATIPDVLTKLRAILSTPTGSPAAVTISLANPGVVTWNAHGLSNGDLVFLTTTGSLPYPFKPNQFYYVRNKTTNNFQLSTSPAGSILSTNGSTQSGTHTAQKKAPATLDDWPKFTRKSVTFFCVGARGAVMAEAESFYHTGYNTCSECQTAEGSAYSGNGASREVSVTIKTVRIPPTIHAEINLDDYGGSFVATASASAAGMGVTASRSAQAIINAYIYPLTVPATPDAIDIPNAGLFLFDTDVAPYKYDWLKYHVVVLNGANL